MGQSTTESVLESGRDGTVRLVDGGEFEGRFVSFGGWLHGEVTVSRGVAEACSIPHRAEGCVRVLGTARRSWPLEQVRTVVWA